MILKKIDWMKWKCNWFASTHWNIWFYRYEINATHEIYANTVMNASDVKTLSYRWDTSEWCPIYRHDQCNWWGHLISPIKYDVWCNWQIDRCEYLILLIEFKRLVGCMWLMGAYEWYAIDGIIFILPMWLISPLWMRFMKIH